MNGVFSFVSETLVLRLFKKTDERVFWLMSGFLPYVFLSFDLIGCKKLFKSSKSERDRSYAIARIRAKTLSAAQKQPSTSSAPPPFGAIWRVLPKYRPFRKDYSQK